MAVWDYYLTVYDTDGAVRVEPSKTTIDIMGENMTDAPASYSADTELSESGTGTVTIMFNYNQPWEQAWFDAIENKAGSVQLVSYDENRRTLNDALAFEIKPDVDHYGGKVGEILIKLGQSNFTENGRYYVRVRSEGHDTVLVPIHVVNEKAPTLKVTGESDIRSGEDITFVIDNMVYGIINPTYAAELKRPDGRTVEMEMISDWYQIGPYLYMYNTVDADGIDRNKIPYKGEYTITVHSNGFKDMSAKFTVSDGKEAQSSEEFDMVTSATTVSTGGGTSGSTGGGQMVSADVKFNADLLINAKIITDCLNIENEAAQGINDRWRSMTPDSVSASDTTLGGFDWNDYYAAVSEARIAGRYLSFAEYSRDNSDLEKLTVPHSIKSVLENNLLGDLQYNGSWVGRECPFLRLVKQENEDTWTDVSKVSEGESINLICYDTEYLAALKSVNLNGNSADLKKGEDYELFISDEAGMMLLSIHPSTQTLMLNRSNTITLDADGYRKNILRIYCGRDLEQDLYLTTDKTEYTRGDTVAITVENSGGDFLKYLSEIEITTPSGATKRVLSAAVGGTASYYYTADQTTVTITGETSSLFEENGAYTITLKAADYYNALSADITVNGELKAVPNTRPEGSVEADENYDGIYHYFLNFGTDDRDSGIGAWKRAITAVTVNGNEYSETGLLESISRSKYAWPTQTGNDIVMELYSKPGFDVDGENEIVISAKGYEDLTVAVNGADGKLAGAEEPEPVEEAEKQEAPAVSDISYSSQWFGDSYYRLSFEVTGSDLKPYIDSITKVTVGDTEYEKTYSFWNSTAKWKTASDEAYGTLLGIDITTDGVAPSGITTITIEAEGYETQVVSISI